MTTANNTIAKEIATQIGNKALFMLGAKDLCIGTEGENPFFAFKIRGSRAVNYIKVIYNGGSDLYTIRFIKFSKTAIKTVAEHNDVYCDMMHQLIEKETGLYTHL